MFSTALVHISKQLQQTHCVYCIKHTHTVRSPKHIKYNIQFFHLLFHVFQLPLRPPPATKHSRCTYYLFSKQTKYCILCYRPGTLYHMSRTRHILETNTNRIYAQVQHNIFYTFCALPYFHQNPRLCGFRCRVLCAYLSAFRNIHRRSTIGDIAYVARTCKRMLVSRLVATPQTIEGSIS